MKKYVALIVQKLVPCSQNTCIYLLYTEIITKQKCFTTDRMIKDPMNVTKNPEYDGA